MYDYIKKSYAFQPEVGRRVRHTVTKKEGVIQREGRVNRHRVRVLFDDYVLVALCHPGELEYVFK